MMAALDPIPENELLGLAEPYGLYALDDHEARQVETAIADAAPAVREQFDARVEEVRETMAAQAATFHERPPEGNFDRILADLPTSPESGAPTPLRSRQRRSRRRMIAFAAAASLLLVIAIGVVIARALPGEQPSQVQVVMSAPDATTADARMGTAVVAFTYSRQANAGVVHLTEVPPPTGGMVYQMWLVEPNGTAHSRGTMDAADVRPDTETAVSPVNSAATFGITLEPAGGSAAPTMDRLVVTVPIRSE